MSEKGINDDLKVWVDKIDEMLDDWDYEKSFHFLESVKSQIERKKFISERQKEVIQDIYERD